MEPRERRELEGLAHRLMVQLDDRSLQELVTHLQGGSAVRPALSVNGGGVFAEDIAELLAAMSNDDRQRILDGIEACYPREP